MIEELEEGLRVPGTTIGRVIRSLDTIEPGAKLTEADRLRGSALGWAVSVSDLMLNSGKVYYHQSIEGALELALKDKRELKAGKPKSPGKKWVGSNPKSKRNTRTLRNH